MTFDTTADPMRDLFRSAQTDVVADDSRRQAAGLAGLMALLTGLVSSVGAVVVGAALVGGAALPSVVILIAMAPSHHS